MAKIQLKNEKPSSDAKETKIASKVTTKQKKKKFWPNQPKKVTKKNDDKKVIPVLPPKNPQEFSHNWKALQELLKPEKPSPADPSASTDVPKKEQKATNKKHDGPETPAVTPKVNGRLKSAPSAAKGDKTSTKTHPSASEANKKGEKKSKKRKIEEGVERSIKQKKIKTEDKKKSDKGNVVEAPKIDIWFDDVDPEDIEAAMGPEAGEIARKMQGVPEKHSDSTDTVLVKGRAFDGLTRTVAIDCEMVGVGPEGEDSILARVSIVNQFGKCVYDKHVKPTERVTDYRTAVSGIRPQDIKNGEDFKVVQKEVSDILKGRILVGHALHNDLKILLLDHPKKAIRDTQKYKPFRQRVKSGRPSLKLLCENILNVRVQTKEHCSIQDAQAAMRLYTMEKKNWEAQIKAKYLRVKPGHQKDKPTPSG
ncbi:RNA exonuclease 4 [Spea bombifrons]|uniref:RNA exonuclease 4 n=1 Tax=Spea bombifrons TaxID=233779 RepID=UPI002349132F|nr:RNA exonuclease 4 [Spea bombifrons]